MGFVKSLLMKIFGKKPKKDVDKDLKQIQWSQPERKVQREYTKSRRGQDMSAEAELAKFIDEFLYARFPNADSFKSIQRIFDKEQQLQGVDVIFTAADGRSFCIDEKAQLYYINKDLPTFAFEISFLRDGWPTTGWLCNEALKTDFYLLVWPFATQEHVAGIAADQFVKADCLLIQKKAVLHLLKMNGLSAEKMMQDAERIRAEGRIGKIPIEGVRGIYYFASDARKYREAPINVVITKNHLLSIKQRRYIVTREQVEVQ